MINFPFAYILSPVIAAVVLLLFFFNVSFDFLCGVFFLISLLLFFSLFFSFVFKWRYKIDNIYQIIINNKRYGFFISIFCFVIIFFGGLDIFVNGLKINNPSTYAELNGWGRYVRHISILCWILIPVGFIFFKNKKLKIFFILYAIIFPILIVDRNRLFSSFYVLFFCIVCEFSMVGGRKRKGSYGIFLLLVMFLFFIFYMIGFFRSGHDAFIIESSGSDWVYGMLPLKDVFFKLPASVQQIVLYITTPIFNFSTVYSYDFYNPDFLLSQLSPFNRENYDAYPYAPILVDRFNVGTEFYPWLMWGGRWAVFFSILFMVFTLFVSFELLKIKPNIYTLLIFLKTSYTILFMGFAPQFYILLNFSFFFLMAILWVISAFLKFNKGMK